MFLYSIVINHQYISGSAVHALYELLYFL